MFQWSDQHPWNVSFLLIQQVAGIFLHFSLSRTQVAALCSKLCSWWIEMELNSLKVEQKEQEIKLRNG